MTMRVELDDSAFAAVAQLLRDCAGLSFDESRRDTLAQSVSARMRKKGIREVTDYLDLLLAPEGHAERQLLLDEVTIPETHFFRNPPQIRALRRHVLPELLRQAADSRRLRVWSAGCSTGEEPYTVGMLIRELLPESTGWDVEVLATDISAKALAKARTATYAERSFVMTEPLDRQRWFVLDTDGGGFELRDEVRELVRLEQHNLVVDPPPLPPGECDLIFCRNVTTYFDRDTTQRLMQRLLDSLRPGGYLFLGHAETLWQITDAFDLIPLGDAFVYRRPIPGEERRRILPDRRTEAELSVLRVDRRRGSRGERRSLDDDAAEAAALAAAAPGVPDQRSIETVTVSSAGGTRVRRINEAAAAMSALASPGDDPLDAVRTALARGRFAEAKDLVDDVISVEPLRAEAHYLHGLALTDMGHDAEAASALRRAVYLDPDGGLAHFLLAGALMRLGETLAAARCYRAAAGALRRQSVDSVAEELGGRTMAELADTAAELAKRAEQQAGR
jgi:chemotaxis protein methyltransferase CheR